MTLIATAISRLGIVQASDSNVTDAERDEYAGEVQKVFRADCVGAALAVAGTYFIGGRPMKEWIPAAIEAYGLSASRTLRGFAEFLCQRIVAQISPEEHALGSLMHIAGYVQDEGCDAHPEFWFVRNVDMIQAGDRAGDYVVQPGFSVSEDFWARDYMNPQVRAALVAGREMRYFNGMLEGRVAYHAFIDQLNDFLVQAWRMPNWKFRAPRAVEELARFIELEVQTVGAMYSSSDYNAPYIGGKVRIETIKPPPNAATL